MDDQKHERMQEVWARIGPSPDWKAEVRCTAETDQEADEMADAIVYFTATVPVMSRTRDGKLELVAAGYRAGPAGP